MKKYIIEYVGGTKGDMLGRFLNGQKSKQDKLGKSDPVSLGMPNWLKLGNPYDLTLDRFEEVLRRNPNEFLTAHPLWVTYNPDYLELVKKYDYEIHSLKFEPKHYTTIQIESTIKNSTKFLKGDSTSIVGLLNSVFFKNLHLDNFSFDDIKNSPLLEAFEKFDGRKDFAFMMRAHTNLLFNEMTEHRTLLHYDHLYLGGYPFPHLPEREEEWNELMEKSWCDYDKHGYREFDEPVMPDGWMEWMDTRIGHPANKWNKNIYTKTIVRYLEQWKN